MPISTPTLAGAGAGLSESSVVDETDEKINRDEGELGFLLLAYESEREHEFEVGIYKSWPGQMSNLISFSTNASNELEGFNTSPHPFPHFRKLPNNVNAP